MIIILLPNGATGQADLSPIPVARDNYECVYEYPVPRYTVSYVYALNANHWDAYQMSDLPADLNIRVNSVTIKTLARAANATAACAITLGFGIAGGTYWGTPQALGTDWAVYSENFQTDPASADFWQTAVFEAASTFYGLLGLNSGGVATQAQCTQFWLELDVSVIGELITDIPSLQPSNTIFLNQDFSILLDLPKTTRVYQAPTVLIRYETPARVAGSLNAAFVDGYFLLATLPANLNTDVGKWLFKPYVQLDNDEIIEGRWKPLNARERWT